jgi:hypothetical protein
MHAYCGELQGTTVGVAALCLAHSSMVNVEELEGKEAVWRTAKHLLYSSEKIS